MMILLAEYENWRLLVALLANVELKEATNDWPG